MKKILFLPFAFILINCSLTDLAITTADCTMPVANTYQSGDRLQQIITRYTNAGLPGIVVAMKKGDLKWNGAGGLSSIENKLALQPCTLMYGQSAAKVYTAVTVLQLMEHGKVDLDKSIRLYLPESIWNHIAHSDIITVRMLLNHTSGIHDYAYDYTYATYLLNNGDKVFPDAVFLDYILDKSPAFYPGTKYSYCNSGYYILAQLVEYVAEKKHSVIIREQISSPLNLNHTYYHEEIATLTKSSLVNCYLDRFSNRQLENVSKSQINNVQASKGDDGIVASAADFLAFLEGLLKGKLISQATLNEMKTWVNGSDGKPAYGLGLEYISRLGVDGYGHGGSGIGAGCSLFYYPSKDVTIFIGANFSTLIESPETDLYEKMKDEILAVVFE